MNKNTITRDEVLDNMKDVIVRTVKEFDKPVTYVTVRMKNGFTLRESTTCVDPANYDEEIGKQICLKKIEDKVWFLLGYALQDKLNKVDNEKKVVVDLFQCKAGDKVGIHTFVDGKHYHYTCNSYGEVTKRQSESHCNVDKAKFRQRCVTEFRPGNTYIMKLDGIEYYAKLQDVDMFHYTFFLIDVKTGRTKQTAIYEDDVKELIIYKNMNQITLA